jgi:galactokinase
VNLIGEHTDYNDGFVLPIAIERQIVALYAPRAGAKIRLASTFKDGGAPKSSWGCPDRPDLAGHPQAPIRVGTDLGVPPWTEGISEPAEIDLGRPIEPGQPHWANYPKGVAAGLVARGLVLSGADVLFDSTVPLGAGLSSSAALEVSTALALMEASGLSGAVAGHELALLCQKAEHTFANAPCGIMDQSISILGRAGRALLLDCRDGNTRHIPFDDPNMVLLVADTQVKHAISDGGYAARRNSCESAAAKLGVKALRDADDKLVAGFADKFADKELVRARHVTTEIARTVEAARDLEAGDYHKFGKLMYASHDSMRDDYEISCAELDEIVEQARRCPGVYGARMTGGGFGGCAIVLAEAARAAEIAEAIQKGFAAKFGRACPIFATRAAAGAGKME